MHKTTFIEIIRTFDKDELKRFESFLNSPYFNTRNYTIKLFDEIKKYAPEFVTPELDKEKLWMKLFPGKDYNYGMMKNIIFELTKFSEQFLEIEKFSSDEILKDNALLDKLFEKNLHDIFLMKYGSFEKKKFKSSKIYPSYYRDYCDLKNRLSELGYINSKHRKPGTINERGELLIQNFLLTFGNYYNEFYVSNTDFNEIKGSKFIKTFAEILFDNPKIEECAEFLKESSERNYKVMQVILKLMKAFISTNDVNNYINLKKVVNENAGYFELDFLRSLYSCIITALDNCTDTLKIAALKIDADSEYFDVFKKLVEHKIFATERGLEQSLFMISVKSAAKAKDPEFIENVMKNYLTRISPELQDNMKIFGKVYLNYSRNEFDESLKWLNKINIDAHPMKFNLKNLQILISYEKNDYDMFTYLKDSYKHFLSKNKLVSEDYKQSNMRFVKFTDSLFKLKETKNKHDKDYLKKTIRESIVANKNWLLDKIAQM